MIARDQLNAILTAHTRVNAAPWVDALVANGEIQFPADAESVALALLAILAFPTSEAIDADALQSLAEAPLSEAWQTDSANISRPIPADMLAKAAAHDLPTTPLEFLAEVIRRGPGEVRQVTAGVRGCDVVAGHKTAAGVTQLFRFFVAQHGDADLARAGAVESNVLRSLFAALHDTPRALTARGNEARH